MKRLAGAWCHLLAVTVLVAGIGCMGNIEDESTQSDPVAYAKGGNINYNEVLLVDLGASISAGYTFDPTLVGDIDGDDAAVYSENHHIPGLAALISSFTGSEVDVYNLAVPGWTSTQILEDELPDALTEIPRYYRGAVVTIEAGGNDLRHFQAAHWDECMAFQPSCFAALYQTLDTIDANIRAMVAAIHALGPYPIVIQTQYNPLYGTTPLGTPCADEFLVGFANLAFEGDGTPTDLGGGIVLPPVVGMNMRIRALAAEDALVAVADVNGYLWMTGQQANAMYYSHDCTHPSGVHGPINVTIPNVPTPYGEMDIPVTIPADDVGAGSTLHLQMFGYALQGLFQ